jgi:hypothetical protein
MPSSVFRQSPRRLIDCQRKFSANAFTSHRVCGLSRHLHRCISSIAPKLSSGPKVDG